MIYAYAAIAAVMAVSCLFGYALHGIIDSASKSLTEASEDADHDRWEDDPVPTIPCETCKYQEVSMWYEPCLTCGEEYDKWEVKP